MLTTIIGTQLLQRPFSDEANSDEEKQRWSSW